MGRTAGSRLVVRKSQKILGQKKPERAAAIWSVGRDVSLLLFCFWVLGSLGSWRGWIVRTESGGEDDESSPVVFDELAHG